MVTLDSLLHLHALVFDMNLIDMLTRTSQCAFHFSCLYKVYFFLFIISAQRPRHWIIPRRLFKALIKQPKRQTAVTPALELSIYMCIPYQLGYFMLVESFSISNIALHCLLGYR